jgi:hypothetical protein
MGIKYYLCINQITNIMNSNLKVGNSVYWSGGFGNDTPKIAKVLSIQWCEVGSKYGDKQSNIEWNRVNSRQVVLDLDNGHWCYGTQVEQVE